MSRDTEEVEGKEGNAGWTKGSTGKADVVKGKPGSDMSTPVVAVICYCRTRSLFGLCNPPSGVCPLASARIEGYRNQNTVANPVLGIIQ